MTELLCSDIFFGWVLFQKDMTPEATPGQRSEASRAQ